MEEKLGDTKGVVRSHKSKDRKYNDQNKRTKEQTMINKTYTENILKIGQLKSH
jgi:hypothetical protein